ncbi:MAG: hypothetical protein ACRCTR_00690 [Actinomycetota bacterium]
MEVHDKLDAIAQTVEQARSVPMSASVMVNRDELLTAIERLRTVFPEELQHADVLLAERDAVLAQGRQEAQRIIAQAEVERDRLIDEVELIRVASARATEIMAQADDRAQRLRLSADDYVDRTLGEFEVALERIAGRVRQGRERLAQRLVETEVDVTDDAQVVPLAVAVPSARSPIS